MATFKKFEEIDAWKKARELAQQIYKASISILSNISEGFERSGRKEFIQFLAMSKGSVGEVQSQLYMAIDQNYINQNEFNYLFDLSKETGKLIGGLMHYLKQSDLDGTKFDVRKTRNQKLETQNT